MSLYFREVGSGQPVIILHGLFGASDNWLTIARQLSTDYKLILPDLRNHGRSFKSETFDYQSMSNDLVHFIEENGIDDPIIIGHSMGGKVAMNFAVNHQSMLSKLIVVDIGPKAYPIHHQQILKGLNNLDLTNIKSRKEADDSLSHYVEEAGVRQFLLKNLDRNEDGVFTWKLNLPIITREIESVGEALSAENTFSKPSLFVKGEKSEYIVGDDSLLISQIFPGSRIVSIPGAGHWVHAENPLEFLSEIKAFLSE